MSIPYAAIIFDMDGTLVDSEVVWHKAETAMFESRGLAYTEEVREQIIGLRLDEMFTKLIAHYDMPESVEELSVELNQRMMALLPNELEAKRGANEIIRLAEESGRPYCIASSSPLPMINAIVKTMGWSDRIPLRFSADEVPRGKPAPDIYLHAAEQLGVNATDCLALEDSPNGARSAVAAGMTTFAIPDTHTSAEAFDGITQHVFTSLHDVIRYLKA